MSRLANYWLLAFQRQADLGIYWPTLERIAPDQRADRLAVAELERAGHIVEAVRFTNGSNFKLAELKTVEAELTRLEPLTADIQLSTGRIVKHSPEPNGSQLATPTPGPAEMTEAEWDEYCAVLVADTRATKTVQVAELTRLEMEEK